MNAWECARPGCARSAVGVGGATGLRAVGWWFVVGGPLLCPEHRPDPSTVHTEIHGNTREGEPCSVCSAEQEADRLQRRLIAAENPEDLRRRFVMDPEEIEPVDYEAIGRWCSEARLTLLIDGQVLIRGSFAELALAVKMGGPPGIVERFATRPVIELRMEPG